MFRGIILWLDGSLDFEPTLAQLQAESMQLLTNIGEAAVPAGVCVWSVATRNQASWVLSPEYGDRSGL